MLNIIINLGCDQRKKGVIIMMTLTINTRNHTIEMPSKKYATAACEIERHQDFDYFDDYGDCYD